MPVLTEAFHLLSPGSLGSQRLIDFVNDDGLTIWFPDDAGVHGAFDLMIKYADVAMDFADASLVQTAEKLNLRKIFSIDRNDFATYRIKRGHR